MKKRSLALLLAAAMATGLAGCSGGGSTPETSAAPTTTATAETTAAQAAEGGEEKADDAGAGDKADLTTDEINLTVWHIAIDETRHQTVTNAINRFMEKYPNIKVVDVPNENDPYKTKLATAMAAGSLPDLSGRRA